MDKQTKEILKSLPSIDRISRTSAITQLCKRYPRTLVLDEIRQTLGEIRKNIVEGLPPTSLEMEAIVNDIISKITPKLNNSLKRGINGVGVILHTGMGRAPLSAEAQQAVLDSIMNYSTLQISTETGKRGHRDLHIEKLLIKLTGAEAATVVNNNAAATMLVLNTLAEGKECIVSRGQLVEIGGAFRIPDVMERSRATLKEVGTTNRTHLRDYEKALIFGDEAKEQKRNETGLLLHVHKSNYYISGFTSEPSIAEMASVAHKNDLPLYDDLGSGCLINLEKWNLPHEPTVQESIAAGADVVSFSGDKLLGGPQSGIIVGKKEIIEKIRKNQLSRTLRCDKMTYAALEATLRLFLDEETLPQKLPVLHMLTEDIEDVKKRAQSLQRRIRATLGPKVKLFLKESVSEVGSGSLSWATIPTVVLCIQSNILSAEKISAPLRQCSPPVFGRIFEDTFSLDCRTILHKEVGFILKALEKTFEGLL